MRIDVRGKEGRTGVLVLEAGDVVSTANDRLLCVRMAIELIGIRAMAMNEELASGAVRSGCGSGSGSRTGQAY